jgi:hypothetical protein
MSVDGCAPHCRGQRRHQVLRAARLADAREQVFELTFPGAARAHAVVGQVQCTQQGGGEQLEQPGQHRGAIDHRARFARVLRAARLARLPSAKTKPLSPATVASRHRRSALQALERGALVRRQNQAQAREILRHVRAITCARQR